MNKRPISTSDILVAPINFGGNVFGWTLDKSESFRILDAFVGAGFNFIDTANTYPWWVNGTGGLSEEIIGQWMAARKNRGALVIATKVGSETKEHPKDVSRAHILDQAEKSLKRLQTDYIDLYYTHFDDEKTPVDETMAAYHHLIQAGTVRLLGASNISVDRLTESFSSCASAGLPTYQALQPHYNLVERAGYEGTYLPLVRKHSLSVFPYFSLARGFLTGKYRSTDDLGKSVRGGGVKEYLNDRGFRILQALDDVSDKHNTKPATVALAWLLSKNEVTAPIVSATKVEHIHDMARAPELTLDAEDLDRLDLDSQL
ncbi:MAG: aldo/keto reductase [Spirochaetales bacterium]|nr:aldo/keto reductase [Spirochaetales bacterium]